MYAIAEKVRLAAASFYIFQSLLTRMQAADMIKASASNVSASNTSTSSTSTLITSALPTSTLNTLALDTPGVDVIVTISIDA